MDAGLTAISKMVSIAGSNTRYDIEDIFCCDEASSKSAESFLSDLAHFLMRKNVIAEWLAIIQNIEFVFLYDNNFLLPSKNEYNKYLCTLYCDDFEIILVFKEIRNCGNEGSYIEFDVERQAFDADCREIYS